MDIRTLQTQILAAVNQGDFEQANYYMNIVRFSMTGTPDLMLNAQILVNISMSDWIWVSNSVKAQTAGHFLAVMPDMIPAFALAQTLNTFAINHNLAGVEVVLANISDAEAHSQDMFQSRPVLTNALEKIAFVGSYSPVAADKAQAVELTGTFMEKFMGMIPESSLTGIVSQFAQSFSYDGIDAVIGHMGQVGPGIKAILATLDAASPLTDVKIMTAGNDTNLYTYNTAKVDVIYGMEGDDYIGTRNDTSNNYLFGDAGNDRLGGGHGNDYISGGIGNDQLYGGAGNDKLLGGRGDDTLLGENGNDSLDGGEGADKLYGQAGADTFVLDTIGKGVDTIADFSKAQGDKIDISDVLDRYDPLDDAIADFVKVTKVGAGTSISIDADGAGADNQAVEVAKLTGVVFNNVQEMLDAGVLITV